MNTQEDPIIGKKQVIGHIQKRYGTRHLPQANQWDRSVLAPAHVRVELAQECLCNKKKLR